MIRHDLSHWPLVVTASRGAPTSEDLAGFSDAWNSWLNRGERFAILRILADPASHSHPQGGAKEKKNWLQRNADGVKRQVIAMATVVPFEIYPQISAMNAQKLFSVPASTFLTVEDALDWLTPLLGSETISVDGQAVKAAIAGLLK